MLFLSTSADGRTCKKFITALLKSTTATQIKRLQYCKDYQLSDNSKQIIQTEQKLLAIRYDSSKKTKLTTLADKLLGLGQRDIVSEYEQSH